MNYLLEKTFDAHGGLDRWRSFNVIEASLENAGLMWKNKGWQNVFDDEQLKIATFTADTREQCISVSPLNAVGVKATYRPDVITIETADGNVLARRESPRQAFIGQTLESPWDELQFAFFRCCAMWNYLTAPFMLALPGISVEEIEPWDDRGTVRRRLRVAFPKEIQTHCTVQDFHIDDNGLIARLDYIGELAGAVRPTAHYVYDYKSVQGIMVPMTRRAYRQDESGNPMLDPVVVSIDIHDVRMR